MIWAWLRRKLGLVRPPLEKYVRVSHDSGYVVEPGLEFRTGDDFEFLTGMLHDVCSVARVPGQTVDALAERVGELIEEVWPDRAYFVEVHDDAWIQIFQPYGVPRNV